MQALLKQLGLTPAKGALVAGLMLLLAIIWGPQIVSFGSSSSTGPTQATANLSTSKSTSRRPFARTRSKKLKRNIARKTRAFPATATASHSSKREMPALAAFEAGAYDPFMVPSWSPAAVMIAQQSDEEETLVSDLSMDEMEERASSLRQAGVAMILVSSSGQMAKIGDQTVQVGDEIDGFRVMEITAEGVVLKPKANAPTSEEDRDDPPSSL